MMIEVDWLWLSFAGSMYFIGLLHGLLQGYKELDRRQLGHHHQPGQRPVPPPPIPPPSRDLHPTRGSKSE